MIEITNLQKTFEDSDLTVLKDISLKIEDGDIYGLVVNPPFFGVLTV